MEEDPLQQPEVEEQAGMGSRSVDEPKGLMRYFESCQEEQHA